MATFIIYKDNIDEYRWNLKSANGKNIADSGEGYNNHQDIVDAINWIKKYAHGADVKDLTK